MSLGLVVLEKKLFTRTRTRTPTPQNDDIKKCFADTKLKNSTPIKVCNDIKEIVMIMASRLVRGESMSFL